MISFFHSVYFYQETKKKEPNLPIENEKWSSFCEFAIEFSNWIDGLWLWTGHKRIFRGHLCCASWRLEMAICNFTCEYFRWTTTINELGVCVMSEFIPKKIVFSLLFVYSLFILSCCPCCQTIPVTHSPNQRENETKRKGGIDSLKLWQTVRWTDTHTHTSTSSERVIKHKPLTKYTTFFASCNASNRSYYAVAVAVMNHNTIITIRPANLKWIHTHMHTFKLK